MVLRYVVRVPWHEAGIKQDTAEVWLSAWSEGKPSVWDRVRAIVEASGHLAALVA
jgi:hypothetical protein